MTIDLMDVFEAACKSDKYEIYSLSPSSPYRQIEIRKNQVISLWKDEGGISLEDDDMFFVEFLKIRQVVSDSNFSRLCLLFDDKYNKKFRCSKEKAEQILIQEFPALARIGSING